MSQQTSLSSNSLNSNIFYRLYEMSSRDECENTADEYICSLFFPSQVSVIRGMEEVGFVISYLIMVGILY